MKDNAEAPGIALGISFSCNSPLIELLIFLQVRLKGVIANAK
jgi:hypothetical protein